MTSLHAVALTLLLSLSAFAQTASPAPQTRIITQGGAVVFQATPGGAAPVLDPQVAALMQQAGVDQNVTAQAEFDPPVITLGQRSTYRVTVTAMTEGVSVTDSPPAPAGLQLTLAGRGFNYGTGAGGLQPRTTFNFRVSATNAGTFVIPPFQASANAKPLTVPEARLTVLPAGAPGARPGTGRLVAEVADTEFYIGQSVPVRLMMLDPGDNSVQGVTQPQITGDAFISENWTMRYRREARPVDGRVVIANICEVSVYPIKAGRLQLSATAHAIVRRGVFNPAMPQVMENVMVDSDPITVTVQHVPKEGELPGFTGGVGTFQLDAPRVSTNVVRAGEPLTLTVTVKGEGNLTRLVPPKLERLRGWQTFAPATDASGAPQIQMRGSVSFTYTLIPLSDRIQSTPAIPFSCFDPKKKAHVDLTIPPVPITVQPPPGGVLPIAETAKTAVLGVDDSDLFGAERELVLTGLMDKPGRRVSTLAPLQQRGWFLALQIVPAAVLGGMWLRERRRRYLAQHPEVVLRAKARRGVRRQLRLARQAASARDVGGFVAAGVNALREASAPRAAGNPNALVCADVLSALEPSERDGQEGALVRQLFGAADAQRFVDKKPDSEMVATLQPELESLLGKWRTRL
ncbi:MAG: BatD family protein [Verrucomicrobia bacterium]|nr:BatD family protein [Verrucomicrobiota bacterium]